MSQCLATSLHGWNHAWERKLDEVHIYFIIKQNDGKVSKATLGDFNMRDQMRTITFNRL